jgi:hypothetical protein
MCGSAQGVHIASRQIYANCSYLLYNTKCGKQFVYQLFVQQCKLVSVERIAEVWLRWDAVPQRQLTASTIELNQILSDMNAAR